MKPYEGKSHCAQVKYYYLNKIFLGGIKDTLSYCFSFLYSNEFNQNELVPIVIINISKHCMDMTEQSILLQTKQTEKIITNSEFISGYLTHTSAILSMYFNHTQKNNLSFWNLNIILNTLSVMSKR